MGCKLHVEGSCLWLVAVLKEDFGNRADEISWEDFKKIFYVKYFPQVCS